MNIEARGRYHYFLIFTDDLSRCEYIYLMKHKSETFGKFEEFQSEVENHRNKNKSFYDMITEVKYLSYEFGLNTSPSYLLFQTLLSLFWTLTCMI